MLSGFDCWASHSHLQEDEPIFCSPYSFWKSCGKVNEKYIEIEISWILKDELSLMSLQLKKFFKSLYVFSSFFLEFLFFRYLCYLSAQISLCLSGSIPLQKFIFLLQCQRGRNWIPRRLWLTCKWACVRTHSGVPVCNPDLAIFLRLNLDARPVLFSY